jgi:hypothetical protein
MAEIEGFRWLVYTAGYTIVRARQREWPQSRDLVPMVCRPDDAGSETNLATPLDNPALFRRFADTPLDEDGVLQFANRYGLLGGHVTVETDVRLPPSTEFPRESFKTAEPVSAWLNSILRMRQVVALWDMLASGDTQGAQQVIVHDVNGLHFHSKPEWFVPDWRRPATSKSEKITSFAGEHLKAGDPIWYSMDSFGDLTSDALWAIAYITNKELDGKSRLDVNWRARRPVLSHQPQSLLGALWLQVAESINTGKRYRVCKTCDEWFELPLRGSRISREYCSDACRSKAYRGRQERAQALAAEGVEPKQIARQLDTTAAVVRKWLNFGKGK